MQNGLSAVARVVTAHPVAVMGVAASLATCCYWLFVASTRLADENLDSL